MQLAVVTRISTHRTHPVGYEFETPIELNGIFSSDGIFVIVDPTRGPVSSRFCSWRKNNGGCFDEQGLQPN